MNGSAPSSFHPPDLECRLTEEEEVNCSSRVYSSRSDWRHSRSFVNEQIRRLRAQLYELKEIRKHLKDKRPFRKSGGDEEEGEEEEEDETSGIPPNAVQCRCQGEEGDEDGDHVDEARVPKRRKSGGNAFRPSRRQRLRLQRLRRRLRRKERRRQRRERLRRLRKAGRRARDRACNDTMDENLNCFSHDNSHWKTAPFWTGQ